MLAKPTPTSAMSKLLFLVITLLAGALRAQSPKFIVDVVPVDLPYQRLSAQMYGQHICGNPHCGLKGAVYSFGSPSMRQVTAISKSFHGAINYSVHKLWHRRETDDPLRKLINGGGEAITGALANLLASYLPLGSGWAHEEFHRNALTSRQIYSYDDIYNFKLLAETVSVSQVTDPDLVAFKRDYPTEHIRAAEAGIEGEYQVITSMQKDAFFYDIKTGSTAPIFYLITIAGTSGYVRVCAKPESNKITNDINSKEKTIPVRDWVGLDFNAWVYDLHRPNEPFTDRGVHPSGVGINRYIKFDDMTPEMVGYLRTMGNRQLLNYVNPQLLGIRRIRLGSDTYGNVALRHYLTSFGDDINLDLFYKRGVNNFYAVIHRYSNQKQSFGGLEVQWVDKPIRVARQPLVLTMRGMAWSQPAEQSFFATKGKPGGLFSVQLRTGSGRVWQPYIEAEAKTAGWVAGNPFLDAKTSVRAGVMVFVR